MAADGMVEHDGMVGQLLDKLKELGLEENTIVMYALFLPAYEYVGKFLSTFKEFPPSQKVGGRASTKSWTT